MQQLQQPPGLKRLAIIIHCEIATQLKDEASTTIYISSKLRNLLSDFSNISSSDVAEECCQYWLDGKDILFAVKFFFYSAMKKILYGIFNGMDTVILNAAERTAVKHTYECYIRPGMEM